MDFKKYGVIYLLIVFLLFLFILTKFFPDIKLNQVLNLSNTTTSKFVTVVVYYGNEQKEYRDVTAPNVYLALEEALKGNVLDIVTTEEEAGVVVEKIGDYANSEENTWVYFVNGETSDVTADQKLLLVGDKVEWKYLKLSR